MSVEPYVVKPTGWFAAASKYVTEGSASFTRRMPPGDCMRATFQIVRAMQAVEGAERSTRNGSEIGCLESCAPGKYFATICSPTRRTPVAPSAQPCAPHCESPIPCPQPFP